MISHTLARQLEGAGFPQREINYFDDKKGDIYIPTLSELIEACGDNFASLQKKVTGWTAFSFTDKTGKIYSVAGEGKTPEEAVTKLWLALNKK